MRIAPNSLAFSWLLGLLSALPTFGIDMILPTLPATAAALGAPASEVGLAMSAYLLGLGAALSFMGRCPTGLGAGPSSCSAPRCSRSPAWAACWPIRCQFLVFRTLQGVGASGPGMGALTIVRDLFEGEEARAKMSYVVFAINIVPMIAPSVGAALLTLGGWQAVYWVPIAGGCVLLVAMRGLAETARIDPARLTR